MSPDEVPASYISMAQGTSGGGARGGGGDDASSIISSQVQGRGVGRESTDSWLRGVAQGRAWTRKTRRQQLTAYIPGQGARLCKGGGTAGKNVLAPTHSGLTKSDRNKVSPLPVFIAHLPLHARFQTVKLP